jgi:hypothetical protein
MAADIFYHMDALNWRPGFFCSYQAVIGFLNFCEQEKPTGFRVFFEMGLYFDPAVGPNWWEYYFEPIEVGKPTENTVIEHPGDMIKSYWNTEAISTISRERAAELIRKYIKVKRPMQEAIDQFVRANFDGHYVIGIHYRGTDKSSEAVRVPYERVRGEVMKYAMEHPNYKVFVATDEQGFVSYMKSQFGSNVCCINAHRSNDIGTPVHHKDGNPVSNPCPLGEEAVMDCYLLAKSDVMIRTFSNLSSSAANINPNLPVVNLNQQHYKKDLQLR